MRYFVTGGAGFIGANFIEYLFQNVDQLTKVTIYDKFTYAANSRNFQEYELDPRLTVIRGDLCDSRLLERSMANHDFVVNFAAESHVDRSINNAKDFVLTNILGAFNVLEASRKIGIRTVIHVSTDEVYGSLKVGSADEGYPLQPNSPYAASKGASDLLARSYFVTHGMDVRITRCCNNYGKYQYPEKVIPVFIKKLNAGHKIPIYGDGKNIREWIHVSDHARGILTVLEKGQPGEIYNIGSGFHLTNNDLASAIIDIAGLSQDMRTYVEDRLGHDHRYSLNSSKIESLGFKQLVNFNLGLEETFKWYNTHHDWWTGQEGKN